MCAGGLWALARYKNLEYAPSEVRGLSPKHRGVLAAHLAGRADYMTHDPVLGWTIRPHGARGQYRANGQGLRGDRDYSLAPPPGKVRVAAFGDSFTHASDVGNPFTWEALLERMEPRLEVLNFGVPGYGHDQAYLRYRKDGIRFRPHVVLLGFMSDDVNRVVNVYRPFFFHVSGLPLAKPRFELAKGGGLALVPNPLPRLAELPAPPRPPRDGAAPARPPRLLLRPTPRPEPFRFPPLGALLPRARRAAGAAHLRRRGDQPGSEASRVTVAIYEDFRRTALAQGSYPVALFFPDRRDFRALGEGRPRLYQPLRDELLARGYPVIDLLDGFEPTPRACRESSSPACTTPGAATASPPAPSSTSCAASGLTTPEGVKAAIERERAAGEAGTSDVAHRR